MTINFLTTRDAARLLGVSVRTAQQWLEQGKLKGWKTDGGHRRIDRESVLKLCRKHNRETAKSKEQPALPVLVVEDDVELLKLYRLQIARWPFDVSLYTATNGFEGLVMVGEVMPRLLICDLRLPGVSGFQILRILRGIARYRAMKIVVVSGLPSDEIEAHGGLPEGVLLLGKPIDFSRLEACVPASGARRQWREVSDRPLPSRRYETAR